MTRVAVFNFKGVRMYRVKKRDQSLQKFDKKKIIKAVYSSFLDSGIEDIPNLSKLATKVSQKVKKGTKDIIDIELVQDVVEKLLMDEYPDVAKQYIIYRQKRTDLRTARLTPDKSAISEYIHVAKYARHSDELGRREVFSETIDRVQDMHVKKFPEKESEIKKAFDFVRSKKVLPSMRSLQFGGDAIEMNNARIFNCAFSLVDRMEVFKETLYLLLCGCGVGYSVQWCHVDKLPKIAFIDNKIVYHHTIEDSIEGWADAIGVLVESFEKGCYVEFNYSKIRIEGAPLKTSGGRAPGHRELKNCIESIRTVFSNSQGRRLRPIECHDVLCYIAQAVVSGGIRRSALLSLFSEEDTEMMYSKVPGNYDFNGKNKQRAMANNSVALNRSTVKKKTFKRIIDLAEDYGEPGFVFIDHEDYGVNPCFHKDTRIHTSKGIMKIGDLYDSGEENEVIADNRVGKGDYIDMGGYGVSLKKATPVFLTQKNADVYEVTLDSGASLKVTDNHKFPTPNGRKELKDLSIGDMLLTQSDEGEWGIEGSFNQGLLLGTITGDGHFESNDAVYINVWEDDFDTLDLFKEAVNTEICSIPSLNGKKHLDNSWMDKDTGKSTVARKMIGGRKLYRVLYEKMGITNPKGIKNRVPEFVWRGSRDTVVGYLQGLFFSDGSVQLTGNGKKSTISLRLAQSNKELLKDVQVILNNFGISSKVYLRRQEAYRELPDGNGGTKSYFCRDQYELIINRPNLIRFMDEVDLFGRKQDIASSLLAKRGYACRKPERHLAKVCSIDYFSTEDVYCLTQEDTNIVTANGVVTGNCGEASLFPVDVETGKTGFSFCNLMEINMAKCKTKEDFMSAVEAASVIGTLQASYTDFPYLGEVTERIVRREALLGVGLTGMMDNPDLSFDADTLREGAAKVIEVNKKLSKEIGISQAARATLVKPSGCRPWYGLVTTAEGIFTLEDLFVEHCSQDTWSSLNVDYNALQEGSTNRLMRTFQNGDSEVKRIKLNYGMELDCTSNHKWFISKTRSNGKYTTVDRWKKTSDIVPGDVVATSIGIYDRVKHADLKRCDSVAASMRSNFIPLERQPEKMSPDIAWVLGYLWGDGSLSNHKYRIRFCDSSKSNLLKAQRILRSVFGLEGSLKKHTDRNAYHLDYGSKHFYFWLQVNGISKYSGKVLDILPKCLRTSSKEDIIAFISGLIDADGCVSFCDTYVKNGSGARVTISSAYDSFTSHLQHVCWAVGLVCGRSLQTKGESKQNKRNLWHMDFSNHSINESFRLLVSHSEKMKRLEARDDFTIWKAEKDVNNCPLTGVVKSISSIGILPTYDVEVANDPWFYAGAVKSHNTASLCLGCVGSGIHPHHSRRYFRRVSANPIEKHAQYFQKVNPHMVKTKPDGSWVIEFPIEAPKDAVFVKDLPAIDFMDLVFKVYKNWVAPGTALPESAEGLTHNISATVTFREGEMDEVVKKIWENKDTIAAMSFAPYFLDKEIPFAPREAVTTEEDEVHYNYLIEHYTPVDWSEFTEDADSTTHMMEGACIGGACVVVYT